MNDHWPGEREAAEHRHHEAGVPDFSVRGLLAAAAGVALLAALGLVVAELSTPHSADIAARQTGLEPRRIDEPPDPRITQSHRLERLLLEQRVDEQLNSYAWIDREQGLARIPIQRAIDLVLENGFPAPTGTREVAPADPAQEGQPDED